MNRFGFKDYDEYEIVAAANTIKNYIWKNYCRDCIEDSGIRENEDFNYDECEGNGCFIRLTNELLEDIIKVNTKWNTKGTDMNDEILFEITETIGTITPYPTGWNKEINVVKWNTSKPKFDIRDWSPDHDRMSRGITLYEEEILKLRDLLNEYFG